MSKYRIAIAGSTQHTVQCAEALFASPEFEITWILTPQPRLLGRKQILTKNPLHLFAEEHHVPLILLENTIDAAIQHRILTMNSAQAVDFLLVIDFGYLIPDWLLDLPAIAPLNVHLSALPAGRGRP